MAERERKKKQQNWEQRSIFSLGPSFRIDTSNPQMGISGEHTYTIYGVTQDNDQSSISLDENGLFSISNDRDIQISAGRKNDTEGVDIGISSFDGDITLTAMRNGSVRLKGRNIILDALEDIDIIAGRNIKISGGSTIVLSAIKVDLDEQGSFLGSLVNSTIGSLGGRIFSGTPLSDSLGFDTISSVFGGGLGSTIGGAVGGPLGSIAGGVVDSFF